MDQISMCAIVCVCVCQTAAIAVPFAQFHQIFSQTWIFRCCCWYHRQTELFEVFVCAGNRQCLIVCGMKFEISLHSIHRFDCAPAAHTLTIHVSWENLCVVLVAIIWNIIHIAQKFQRAWKNNVGYAFIYARLSICSANGIQTALMLTKHKIAALWYSWHTPYTERHSVCLRQRKAMESVRKRRRRHRSRRRRNTTQRKVKRRSRNSERIEIHERMRGPIPQQCIQCERVQCLYDNMYIQTEFHDSYGLLSFFLFSWIRFIVHVFTLYEFSR